MGRFDQLPGGAELPRVAAIPSDYQARNPAVLCKTGATELKKALLLIIPRSTGVVVKLLVRGWVLQSLLPGR